MLKYHTHTRNNDAMTFNDAGDFGETPDFAIEEKR